MSAQPKTKTVYVVWTNTDLTEGRGHQVPIHICEAYSTAIRLAKGQGVQGSNAEVSSFEAIQWRGYWCGPFYLNEATTADKKEQAARDERTAVIDRAKAAGLSDADLKILASPL